jgi:hypothetical protein
MNPGVFHVPVMLEMYSCYITQIITCLQSLMSPAWAPKISQCSKTDHTIGTKGIVTYYVSL